MDDLAELVTVCVVALASAAYAQFGVRLERIAPPPQPRAIHAVAPRRGQSAAFAVVRAQTSDGPRAC